MSNIPCRFSEQSIPRYHTELGVEDLASEEVLHLRRARVATAEYVVLQHDFPELRTENLVRLNPHLRAVSTDTLQREIHAILDAWLVANAAYVSVAQAEHNSVNGSVATDGRRATAYRPPNYGRAVVVPVQDLDHTDTDRRFLLPASVGLLDLKGVGVAPGRVPSLRPQSTGLEYLASALADFLIKKVVDEVLARALPSVWSIPVYAVLDLGFDIVGWTHGTGPAGMHVRRAHRRSYQNEASLLELLATMEIEWALRRYGLTAATIGLQLHISYKNGRVTWQKGREVAREVTDPSEIGLSLALLRDRDEITLDRRDIQIAKEVSWPPAQAQLVDFGAIRVVSKFDSPVVRNYQSATLDEIVWPDDPEFVQPDPRVQLPVATWHRWELAHHCVQIANAFRQGALSADDVRRNLDGCLLEWRDQLPDVAKEPG